MSESAGPKIVISDDCMAAFMILPHGVELDIRGLEALLESRGVVHGVSTEALLEAISGTRGRIHQVAWGTGSLERSGERAVPSPAAVFRFPSSVGRPEPKVTVDGSFAGKWRSLMARGAVRPGDVLSFVRNMPKDETVLGVTGKRMSGWDPRSVLRESETTEVSAKGDALLARRGGVPYVDDGVPRVMDHVTIAGDISKATGNLDFPGDITVEGSVASGFSVSAGQCLIVHGSVSGCAFSGGDLAVKGGVIGSGAAESRGGIFCRFCENSVLRSVGPVTVSDGIIHSVVESEAYVVVTGEHGRIVGGQTRARIGVSAYAVGSPMGMPTVIETGISPKHRRLQAKLLMDLRDVRDELARAVRPGARLGARSGYDEVRVERMRASLESREKSLKGRLSLLEEHMKGMTPGYFRAQRVLADTRVLLGMSETVFTSSAEGFRAGVI